MIKNWEAIRWRRVAALTTRFDSQIHPVVIIAATPANAGRDFSMLTVSSEQFDILAAHRAEDRLLECVLLRFVLCGSCTLPGCKLLWVTLSLRLTHGGGAGPQPCHCLAVTGIASLSKKKPHTLSHVRL